MSKKTVNGIDSYHSVYPLSYYEEGVVYAFYHRIGEESIQYEATEEQILKGVTILNTAKRNFYFSPENVPEKTPGLNFKREFGVVVGREEKTATGPAKIHVLFEKDGQYFIRKYAVDHDKVFWNDKEWSLAMPNKKPIGDGSEGKTGPTTGSSTGPTRNNPTGPVESKATGPVRTETTGPIIVK